MSRPYHVLEYEIDWTRNHPSKLSKVNKRKSQVHKYSRSNESPGSKDDILAETNTEMIHSNGLYGFGVSPPKIKRKSKQVARKDAYSPLLATTEPSQLTTSLDSSRNVDVEQEDDVTNQRYFADHSMEKGGMLDESLELKEPSTSESRFEPLSSFFDRCDKRMARFGPDHIRAQGKKSMESRMEETILKAKHDKLRLDRMLDKLQTDIRQSGVGSKGGHIARELKAPGPLNGHRKISKKDSFLSPAEIGLAVEGREKPKLVYYRDLGHPPTGWDHRFVASRPLHSVSDRPMTAPEKKSRTLEFREEVLKLRCSDLQQQFPRRLDALDFSSGAYGSDEQCGASQESAGASPRRKKKKKKRARTTSSSMRENKLDHSLVSKSMNFDAAAAAAVAAAATVKGSRTAPGFLGRPGQDREITAERVRSNLLEGGLQKLHVQVTEAHFSVPKFTSRRDHCGSSPPPSALDLEGPEESKRCRGNILELEDAGTQQMDTDAQPTPQERWSQARSSSLNGRNDDELYATIVRNASQVGGFPSLSPNENESRPKEGNEGRHAITQNQDEEDSMMTLVEVAEQVWASLIEELRAAGREITMADLGMLSALREPAEAVRMTIGYVSLLLGLKADWKEAMSSVLRKLKVLKDFLVAVDPLMVPLKRVRKAMLVKKEKLRGETCESMESKCKSMGKLFRWVGAFDSIGEILLRTVDEADGLRSFEVNSQEAHVIGISEANAGRDSIDLGLGESSGPSHVELVPDGRVVPNSKGKAVMDLEAFLHRLSKQKGILQKYSTIDLSTYGLCNEEERDGGRINTSSAQIQRVVSSRDANDFPTITQEEYSQQQQEQQHHPEQLTDAFTEIAAAEHDPMSNYYQNIFDNESTASDPSFMKTGLFAENKASDAGGVEDKTSQRRPPMSPASGRPPACRHETLNIGSGSSSASGGNDNPNFRSELNTARSDLTTESVQIMQNDLAKAGTPTLDITAAVAAAQQLDPRPNFTSNPNTGRNTGRDTGRTRDTGYTSELTSAMGFTIATPLTTVLPIQDTNDPFLLGGDKATSMVFQKRKAENEEEEEYINYAGDDDFEHDDQLVSGETREEVPANSISINQVDQVGAGTVDEAGRENIGHDDNESHKKPLVEICSESPIVAVDDEKGDVNDEEKSSCREQVDVDESKEAEERATTSTLEVMGTLPAEVFGIAINDTVPHDSNPADSFPEACSCSVSEGDPRQRDARSTEFESSLAPTGEESSALLCLEESSGATAMGVSRQGECDIDVAVEENPLPTVETNFDLNNSSENLPVLDEYAAGTPAEHGRHQAPVDDPTYEEDDYSDDTHDGEGEEEEHEVGDGNGEELHNLMGFTDCSEANQQVEPIEPCEMTEAAEYGDEFEEYLESDHALERSERDAFLIEHSTEAVSAAFIEEKSLVADILSRDAEVIDPLRSAEVSIPSRNCHEDSGIVSDGASVDATVFPQLEQGHEERGDVPPALAPEMMCVGAETSTPAENDASDSHQQAVPEDAHSAEELHSTFEDLHLNDDISVLTNETTLATPGTNASRFSQSDLNDDNAKSGQEKESIIIDPIAEETTDSANVAKVSSAEYSPARRKKKSVTFGVADNDKVHYFKPYIGVEGDADSFSGINVPHPATPIETSTENNLLPISSSLTPEMIKEAVGSFCVGDKALINMSRTGPHVPQTDSEETCWMPCSVTCVRYECSAEDAVPHYDVDVSDGSKLLWVAPELMRPLDSAGDRQSQSIAADGPSSYLSWAESPYKASDFAEGQSVIANFRATGTWLPGEIIVPRETDEAEKTYDIKYCSGEIERKVAARNIRVRPLVQEAMGGSSEGFSTLFKVGACISANYHGRGDWLPGKIVRDRGGGIYDVAYDNGEAEYRVGEEMLRLHDFAAVSGDSSALAFNVGQVVEANFRGADAWLSGTVRKYRGNGLYDIEYDNGKVEYRVGVECVRQVVADVALLSLRAACDAEQSMVRRDSLASDKMSRDEDLDTPIVHEHNEQQDKLTTDTSIGGPYDVGLKVIVNIRASGVWMEGVVSRVRMRKGETTQFFYDVACCDGSKEVWVDSALILPHSSREDHNPINVDRVMYATSQRFNIGERVIANFMGHGQWCSGVVSAACSDESSYDVDYDDGRKERKVPLHMLRRDVLSAEEVPNHVVHGSIVRYPIGSEVEANFRGLGEWKAGTISRVRANSLYDVGYADGTSEYRMAEDSIRFAKPFSVSHSSPVHSNDSLEVGAKVEANFRAGGAWKTGVVARDRGNGLYDIKYDDGSTEARVGADMIRSQEASASEKAVAPIGNPSFSVGEWVEVNYRGSGVWYLGKIILDRGQGVFDIVDEDGEVENYVGQSMLRPASTSLSDEVKTSSKYVVGMRVEVNYRRTGNWYAGMIQRDRGNGVYDITYDDGEKELRVAESLIVTISKGNSNFLYQEGQRIEAEYRESGHWFAGKIVQARVDGTYDVCYDDDELETKIPERKIRRSSIPVESISTSTDFMINGEGDDLKEGKTNLGVTVLSWFDADELLDGGNCGSDEKYSISIRMEIQEIHSSDSARIVTKMETIDERNDQVVQVQAPFSQLKVDPHDFYTITPSFAVLDKPLSSDIIEYTTKKEPHASALVREGSVQSQDFCKTNSKNDDEDEILAEPSQSI